jgi:DNA-binding CsgD family transcriptional regulator
MNALAAFSRVVTDATSQLGEPDFAQVLSNGIRELIAADDTSLIRYLDAGPPVIEYTLPTKRREKTILNRYVKGPFLLDPFYRAAEVEGRFGVFRLSTLAPSGFKESEYFRTWYHECSFQDECGLLIKLNSGSINLALGMTDGSRRFSKRQVDQLEAIFPAIEALVRRHWSAPAPVAEHSGLRERLQRALGAFGSSVLTRREQQVIELVLLGHSTRLVAEKLGISAETVKLHRKHAYAKLDISSQAELFYLFVDALASDTGDGTEDPLLGYHHRAVSGTRS